MYSGEYLDEKLGHEAINLFAADNGDHYIYINSLGKIAPPKDYEIECVLLGELVKDGVFKVIGKATGLKMLESTQKITKKYGATNKYPLSDEYLNEHLQELGGVTYGGVPIGKLFDDEKTQVLATFKAKEVVQTDEKEDIYIYAYNIEDVTKNHLSPSKHDGKKDYKFAKTNPYMYFPEKNCKGESLADYTELQNIIKGIKWKKESVDKFNLQDSSRKHPITMLEIMRKEDSELSYSNMIHYWLSRKKSILKQFVSEVLIKKDKSIPIPTDNIKIEREIENIDILISYGDTRIIIENKIKADISKYGKDEKYDTQLVKYKDKMLGVTKDVHCFLLSPDYRTICDKEYIELRYSDLRDFFKKLDKKEFDAQSFHFEEFKYALELHSSTTDNRNYNKMMRRMEETVRNANAKNGTVE